MFWLSCTKMYLGVWFYITAETVDLVPWLFPIFDNVKLFFLSLWMTVELMFLVVAVQHNPNRNVRIYCMFVDLIPSWL